MIGICVTADYSLVGTALLKRFGFSLGMVLTKSGLGVYRLETPGMPRQGHMTRLRSRFKLWHMYHAYRFGESLNEKAEM